MLLTAALLGGCPLTLSKPKSEAFLDAMATAERHMRHSRYDDAIASYRTAQRYADRRADRDEALYREAKALKYAGRYGEAVQVLDHLASFQPPGRRTARALYDAAFLRQEQLGLQDEANAGFDRVIREFPDAGVATRALHWRLEYFDQNQDVPGAIAFLDDMLAHVSQSKIGDNLLMAKADLILDKYEDRDTTRAVLQQLVREHPYPEGGLWDDALLRLAEMDVEDGEYERAIEYLRILTNRAENTHLLIIPNQAGSTTLPSMAEAQLRIARIYRDDLQDYDKADDEFEAVEDDFPRSNLRDDAAYERGVMWLEHGEPERGCDILREVVEDFEVGHPRRLAQQRVEADCGGH